MFRKRKNVWLLALFACYASHGQEMKRYTSYVNPFIGTAPSPTPLFSGIICRRDGVPGPGWYTPAPHCQMPWCK